MKKTFKYFAVIWAIAFVAFNIISFVTPGVENGISKYSGSFWIGYVFITLAFIGQLICGYVAFKAENLEKLFYNVPILSVSYTGLIVMLVVGALAMALPGFPRWIAVVVCVIILAITAIAVLKASAAADLVQETGKKVKVKTAFMKSLTADAESLMSAVSDENLKAACRKVSEAIRYSDPMSADGFEGIESQISIKFSDFKDYVTSGNEEIVEKTAKELLALIEDRNNRCKILK